MQPTENTWPVWKILLWSAIAVAVCFWQGPDFVQSFRPPEGRLFDFFQEWTSARNYFTGRPVYSNLTEALAWHLEMELAGPGAGLMWITWNAHPPASILLALPLAGLDYPEAHLVWNLLSLPMLAAGVFLIIRELRLSVSPWAILPGLVLLLLAGPLRSQLFQGQLNLLLLLLITGAWSLAQADRWAWAGVVLGAAAAIKLFPGFLFLYPLVKGKWQALAAGAATFAAINGLALGLFGAEAFETYIKVIVPGVSGFRTSWENVSLTGFWSRMFDPSAREKVRAFWHAPVLARVLVAASALLVTGTVAWKVWTARSRRTANLAFSLTLIGMLLVSPISWEHYFLLLLPAFACAWAFLPTKDRWLFWVAFPILWLPRSWFYTLFMGPDYTLENRWRMPAVPAWNNLVTFALQTYALLFLFVLILCIPEEEEPECSQERGARPVGEG